MFHYILRRIFYGLLVLFGVVVVVFILFQGFGDPSRLVMGQTGDATTQAMIRKELGLDEPKWKQALLYINDVSPVSLYTEDEIRKKDIKGIIIGNRTKLCLKLPYLRTSYQTRKPVGDILIEALPGTILLATIAMFIAVLLGIPLGIIAAVKQNSGWDTAAVFTSTLGISAPSFFIGIIIAYLFGFVWSQWTGLYLTGNWFEIDINTGKKRLSLQNAILPAITLGIRPLSIITQLTRSSVLDVLEQDFVKTAVAKGLSFKVILWRHVLRNALNPVLTAVTGWFAELLAGAFFIEYIFGWKGIGKVTVDALEKLDFPVVMGSVLVTATFFIIMNLVADILYCIIDPRVRAI